jgi:hypothetical protein
MVAAAGMITLNGLVIFPKRKVILLENRCVWRGAGEKKINGFVIESLPSMLDEVVNEIEMSTCASEEIDALQYPARSERTT